MIDREFLINGRTWDEWKEARVRAEAMVQRELAELIPQLEARLFDLFMDGVRFGDAMKKKDADKQ
jgi:hypothetical protein